MSRYLCRFGSVIAAGLFVAGCGGATDAEPPADTTEQKPATVAFNPCDELSDEALRAAGLDPSTKQTSVDSPTGGVWKICMWQPVDGTPYIVSIGTTTFSQEELPGNPTVTGFEDVQIGSRAGKTYHQANDPEPLRCYVSIPAAGGGMHNVILGWRTSQKASIPESPPCTLAVERAKELEPYLP